MDDRLDKIHEDITEIKVTLAINTQLLGIQGNQLAEHMRRTDANEELIKIALIPILTIRKATKAIAWIAALAATAATIYTAFY